MKLKLTLLSLVVVFNTFIYAQENNTNTEKQSSTSNTEELHIAIEKAKKESEKIIQTETARLKSEVAKIEEDQKSGKITKEEADKLKKEKAEEVSESINKSASELEKQVNELLDVQEAELKKLEKDLAELKKENQNNLEQEIESGKYNNDDDFYGIRITDKDDDIVISFKNKDRTYDYKRHKRRTRFKFDLDFGWDGLQENNDVVDPAAAYPEFEMWQSMYFGFSFNGKTRIFKENSPLHIKYGIGLQWSNYVAKGDYLLEKNAGQPVYSLDPIGRNFSNSRVRNLYMTFPVMLQLDFSDRRMDNGWKLGVGAYGGIRWYTWQKVSFRDADGDKTINTTRNAYYMNPFSYGLQAEVGYGVFSIVAKYELSQLFEVANPYDYQAWNLGFKFAF